MFVKKQSRFEVRIRLSKSTAAYDQPIIGMQKEQMSNQVVSKRCTSSPLITERGTGSLLHDINPVTLETLNEHSRARRANGVHVGVESPSNGSRITSHSRRAEAHRR